MPNDPLVKDVSEVDKFDRLLRYVIVGDKFVNYELVIGGYASSFTYPPDVACANLFVKAYQDARSNEIGCWKPIPTPLPYIPPVIVNTPVGNTTSNCDPSYPTVCIPPPPPDLDCKDIPHRRFPVVGSDPHNFDGDYDGIGCESN